MQCYKLSARRSLYNATALQSDLSNQNLGHAIGNLNLESARQNARIVVIGAGLAGLSAAQHLLSHGFRRTVVLEATERYGGRINSQRFGDTFCELGAKWVPIDGSQDSTYELLRNVEGLDKRIKQPERPEYVQINHDQNKVNPAMVDLIDALFRQLCGGLKVSDKVKTGSDLHSLDNVMAYFRTESNKAIGLSFKPEEQNTAREIFQSLFKEFSSVLGCCLEYVNIDHITSCPVQPDPCPIYVPTGLDNIVDELSQRLGKEQLQTGKPVGQIQWTPSALGHRNSVGCLDGSLYNADHIICTLPLGVLKNFAGILFRPSLPQEKMMAIRNLGFGSPVKIYLSYNLPIRLWLRRNLRPLGTLINRVADPQAERSWTQQVVEISQVPSSQHVLEVRVGGGYYEEIEKLPDARLLEQITTLLRKCISNPLVPYPQGMLRSKWSTSACYLGGRPYFSTCSSARDVQRLAAPLGGKAPSLLFAGDATALHGFGTIDAARSSGIREAQRIIEYYNIKQYI
ncbi:protein anon-37Cs [Drosophila miranda]|uniref:GA10395 n=1 Tax=Drosophila miranda TaxID=7229 RepID=D0QWC5_DROMI|nr:protein anon-37Cs [Drosophila miranda]ACN94624.1 GA10395 [Drosophila miranda]